MRGGGGSATTWRRRLRGHETFLPPPPEPAAALWPVRRARAAVRSRTPPPPMARRFTANAANREGVYSGDVSARPGPRCTVGCWRPRVGAGRKGGVSWRRISRRSFAPLWSANSGRSRRSSSSSTAGNRVVGIGREGRGAQRDGPRPEGRVGGNMAGPGGSRPCGRPEGDTARGPREVGGETRPPAIPPVSVLSARRGGRLYGLSDLRLNLPSLPRKTRKTLERARKSWKRALCVYLFCEGNPYKVVRHGGCGTFQSVFFPRCVSTSSVTECPG